MTRTAKIRVYRDDKGEYRWQLRSGNGKIIADSSEGYSSQSRASDAAHRLRIAASSAMVVIDGKVSEIL